MPDAKAENNAAASLAAWLAENGHSVSYRRGADPPDFDFVVDTQPWAVEHTELWQELQGATRSISRAQQENVAARLENELAESTAGKRRAAWMLFVFIPVATPDVRIIRESAQAAIVADDVREFARVPDRYARLHRLESTSAEVGVISVPRVEPYVPGTDRYQFDIQAVVDNSVANALARKVPRLPTVGIDARRVLMLDSRLPLADAHNVRVGLDHQAERTREFDLVFLVTGRGVNLVRGFLAPV